MAVTFDLNGSPLTIEDEPQARLIDVLRDRLRLTAAKIGCDIGRCGACLVLIDGQPANACLLRLYQLHGRSITTPEGLSALPEGRAIQSAFIAEVAFQCGYCAPGMTIAATALLLENPMPDEASIRESLAGNLCRCSGYLAIIRAVQRAPALLRTQVGGTSNPG